jgi:trigger factor
VNRALLERVRQFPGQERKVYDFYRNNPQALAEIRAPLFEDKVIDFITELANVTEKPISVEELYADPDDAGGQHHHDHDHDHDHHDLDHDHHDHDHAHDHGHDHHHDHDHDQDHDHGKKKKRKK